MHQMNARQGQNGDHDGPGDDAGCHHCTCIGSCAVPVAISAPSVSLSLLLASTVSVAAQLPATASIAPRRAADVGLPHANAPPLLVSARAARRGVLPSARSLDHSTLPE
jgi:hypothetical protein